MNIPHHSRWQKLMNPPLILWWLGLCLGGLVACTQEETPVPTPLPPTATHIPTTTATPILTVTPSPANTPLPTVTPPYRPIFEEGSCPFTVPTGATVNCGFVPVLEDREGHSEQIVRLAVAIYRRTDGSSDNAPLLFLSGGPGGDAVEWSASFYENLLLPVLAERDVIIFDMRGTGLSEPSLDCWEVKLLYVQDLQDNMPASERIARYTKALLDCKSRLTRRGIDPTHYTSQDNALDVQDLVTAVGYERVYLYGVSYGTRLAQVLMRDMPDIVEGAILDSVVPIEVKYYNEAPFRADQILQTFFADCAHDVACHTAYPQLEEIFHELQQELETNPRTIELSDPLTNQPYTTQVDDIRFTSAILSGLRNSNTLPAMPYTIYDIYDGYNDYFYWSESAPLAEYENISLGVMISTHCPEQVLVTTQDELQLDLDAYPHLEALGMAAVLGDVETLFAICRLWGAEPLAAGADEPVVSDIPTLILAGKYDPTTPPFYGQQVAEHLNQSYFFEFPRLGHALLTSVDQACPMEIALGFLAEPYTQPNTDCLSDLAMAPFAVPELPEAIQWQPFVSTEIGIRWQIPQEWQDIGNNNYWRSLTGLDPTQLIVQAVYGVTIEEWRVWLVDNFANTGLGVLPAWVDMQEINGLTWHFYTATLNGKAVDFAFAEKGSLTMLVTLVSRPREQKSLYEAVFLPAIEAVEPFN